MPYIVDFWRNGFIEAEGGIKYHEEDGPFLSKIGNIHKSSLVSESWKRIVEGFCSKNDQDEWFELGVTPVPYCGDLSKAKIFFLLLNPGLSLTDYYAEINKDGISIAEESMNTIRQENMNQDYPFMCLNPEYAFWSGFTYWQSRMHPIVEHIQKAEKLSYLKALSFLSQNIASLQLAPYHSKSFSSAHDKVSKDLESTKQAKDYAQELSHRAEKGEILLIVARSAAKWGFDSTKQHPNIVINHNRGFHLGNEDGEMAKAITNFLEKKQLCGVS